MNDIEYLGNIRGDKPQGYSGSLYGGGGNCPTLLARDCKDPVLVLVKIGYIEKGTGKHQSNIVYSKYGLAPCITAMFGIKQPPTMFIEKVKK